MGSGASDGGCRQSCGDALKAGEPRPSWQAGRGERRPNQTDKIVGDARRPKWDRQRRVGEAAPAPYPPRPPPAAAAGEKASSSPATGGNASACPHDVRSQGRLARPGDGEARLRAIRRRERRRRERARAAAHERRHVVAGAVRRRGARRRRVGEVREAVARLTPFRRRVRSLLFGHLCSGRTEIKERSVVTAHDATDDDVDDGNRPC